MTAKLVRVVVVALLTLALAGNFPLVAQQAQKQVSMDPGARLDKGQRTIPNIFAPYTPLRIERPVLVNSPRVEQLTRDGKLMLSLEDAISLALENNLDISVQRYGPWIADTAVLRAKSGVGTASGGFDPVLTSTFAWDRRSIPINNPFLAGGGLTQTALTNYTTQGNIGYQQGFPTGTAYSINFNNTRQSTTSGSTFLNPSVSSSMFFAFQQPLLNGLGFVSNKRGLRLARNNKRIADLTFNNQVIVTVSSVQNMYWDLVFAREDVKVKQRSVELAQKLYNDNKRQVEIGTLAPIEITRAEAEVARTTQDLIVSQTFLLQQQTLLKNAITKNPVEGGLLEVEIVPTDVIQKAPDMQVATLQDAVNEAWQNRPDVRQAQVDLENREITRKATRNAMLPTLTLSGQYSGQGLAGNSRNTTFTPTGTFTADPDAPLVDAAGAPVLVGGVPVFVGSPNFTSTSTLTPAGLSDAWSRLFNFEFPQYSVRLDLTIPIRNRAAQADNAQALLEERQSETRLRQLQNNIVVEVRNAQIALQQNRARVDSAQKSRELAERTLDAEQKKYQLGASTIFFVIQAQRDLAQAESAEVRALADLLKARVTYDQALGRTLQTNSIQISEADAKKGGKNIPGDITSVLSNRAGKY
jgi:outer membrane protein TolC